MNYKIIQDEKLLRGFIDFLPELQEGETYYLCLFARKKYAKEATNLSGDKNQLKRFTASKEYIYDKIKQLECEFGAYKAKGEAVPQEALALYITINPRDLVKATKNSLKVLLDLALSDKKHYNPHAEVLSQIQTAKSRMLYYEFDFDNVSMEDVKVQLEGKINFDCLHWLKTRGGFHLFVEMAKLDKQYTKTWYNSINSLEGVDVRGDNISPVPGCCQGGFVPYFVK